MKHQKDIYKEPKGSRPGYARTIALLYIAVIAILFAASVLTYTGSARPYLEVDKSVDPQSMWPAGSENEPNEATVTLSIKAMGSPAAAIDVVFLMDSSG
jgi:hypothetical protein